MSIKGGSYANFKRALATSNLTLIRAAAAELPKVDLEDALRICLVMRGKEPAAYDRAVLRWVARFAREKAFSLGQLKVAIAAFEGLAENPERSERQLRGLLDRSGFAAVAPAADAQTPTQDSVTGSGARGRNRPPVSATSPSPDAKDPPRPSEPQS